MPDTCTLFESVAFVEGILNGERFVERDIDEMVSNFGQLRGFWSPYVSIDHERGAYSALSFGDVSGVKKGRVKLQAGAGWVRTGDNDQQPGTRAALVTTSFNVPSEVGTLVQSRRLPRVSIEMFDGTFHGPHGLVPTKVLKSVSLLGARSEASKGMPSPAVQFADRNPHGRPAPRSPAPAKCFGDLPMDTLPAAAAPAPDAPMDREGTIAALTAKGLDPMLITEGVPDALLQWMATNCGATMEPDADNVPAAKMFSDAQKQTIGQLVTAAVNKATSTYAPALAQAGRAAATVKAAKIKAFGDRMTGVNNERAYMTPVQFAAIRPMLEILDDAAVKTFADKKTAGTALDESMARLAAAHTSPVKMFGDLVPDAIGGQGAAMTPERRAELLGHTHVGKAVLAKK